MSDAQKLAWRTAFFGLGLGIYFVARDYSSQFRDLSGPEAIARGTEEIAAAVILCWVLGYAYGLIARAGARGSTHERKED
jgi:hypothetical protein